MGTHRASSAARLGLVALLALGGCLQVEETEKVYALGEAGPAGGWVFYDKGAVSDGWRFLEAAPMDLTNVDTPFIAWGDPAVIDPELRSTAIGAGLPNTLAIAIEFPGDVAALCQDLVMGGKDDWFLPSLLELYAMSSNLAKKGIGGFLPAQYYWSSSVIYTGGNNYIQVTTANGGPAAVHNDVTYSSNRVRAARRF